MSLANSDLVERNKNAFIAVKALSTSVTLTNKIQNAANFVTQLKWKLLIAMK